MVKLLLVSAEAPLNAPIAPVSSTGQALGVVESIEVVRQPELCNSDAKLLQELASPIGLYGLHEARELGHQSVLNS